jgi:CRISPR-associated endonuclease/helicase Cas3
MAIRDIRATYAEFVRSATGDPGIEPYDYQHRLAAGGLPELLSVPTGCGKTAAVTLGWLFRRTAHSDPEVRATTPHWLVYVLPQRVLVEQTQREIERWLHNLDLDVRCHVALGGVRAKDGRTWRDDVDRDAVVVGTQDMLLSRALNRGYGDTLTMWPIDFGLLHSGCHWVMDEIQLMGPGLPTTRQLHGLRLALGTAAPCSSTWMSATIDEQLMATVDAPTIGSRLELDTADRTELLAHRLDAAKTVRRLDVDAKRYAADLAAAVAALHRPGRRTLAVLNTVERARQVCEALSRRGDVPTVLVHSRYRPGDRARQVDAALAPPGNLGTIVVSTQVLEAGVDLSADVLVSEAAPWPSIVQRAGRCNRDGYAEDALLCWVAPPNPAPYLEADLDAAVAVLAELQGTVTTPTLMGARTVDTTPTTHAVLRRRDLVELFDTLPDLSGNDTDVTRFVRDADDRSVEVAWRHLGGVRPDTRSLPAREERCPAPIGEVRDWVAERIVWRFDHLDRAWVRCRKPDVRPGMVLVADADAGGYDERTGWSPASRTPVTPVHVEEPVEGELGEDHLSVGQPQWVSLARHSADTQAEATRILAALAPAGISPAMSTAAARAALFHDIGKVHPVFQESLTRFFTEDNRGQAERAGRPWAKSAGKGRLNHGRPHFRHELVSALVLMGDGAGALDGYDERDLAVYLVAAHHGHVRVGVRSLHDEAPAVVLGVADGEDVPAVEVGGVSIPRSRMDLSVIQLGTGGDGLASWSRRMLDLRDRPDLGPFRMAFLEAVVRLADWRASAAAERGVER